MPGVCATWDWLSIRYDWADLASTILLADDEDQILRLLTHVIEREGYSALTACSSTEAIEVLSERAEEIDALVLDVNLPPGGAEGVLAAVWNLRLEIPSVLVSGGPLDGVLEEYVSRRKADFLQKPFRPQELVDWIEENLAGND